MSPRDALRRMAAPFTVSKKWGGMHLFSGGVSTLGLSPVGAASEVQVSRDMGGDVSQLPDSCVPHTAPQRLSNILAEVEAVKVDGGMPQLRMQPRRNIAIPLRLFFLLDVVAMMIGYVIAWVLASLANYAFFDRDIQLPFSMDDLGRMGSVAVVGCGVLLWFLHTGHYRTRMPFWAETQKVFMAIAFAMVMDGFFQFAARQSMSRMWLMAGWGFAAIGIILLRHLARKFMRKKGIWQVRTLLVGSGTVADEAREGLASEPGLGYRIVMQIENLPATLKTSGNTWRLLCDRFSADFVVIALDGHELAESEDAMAMLVREGIPFSVSPPMRNLPVLGMTPQYFFNSDVMLLTPSSNLEQFLPGFLKRSVDILLAGSALLVLSPLFLVLGFLVKRDGGPAFYGDKRIGRHGSVFSCLKFRSMVLNSDTVLQAYLEEHPVIRQEWNVYRKLRGFDPRVTAVGAFMRRLSLDELPQLINVLIGDMSLVGPRPIMVVETSDYHHDILHYCRVRPGITGLWQVSGRNEVTFAERVQMDSWYVRNWSMWHDIAILCKTIPVLLNRKGAY